MRGLRTAGMWWVGGRVECHGLGCLRCVPRGFEGAVVPCDDSEVVPTYWSYLPL
jgi:hypothetical protein